MARAAVAAVAGLRASAESSWRRLLAGSVRARFARGALWCLAEAGLSQGLRLLAFAVAARLLGAQGFGELSMIQNTVGMAGIFAGAGLGLTATRHIAASRQSDPDQAGRILSLCTLLGLVSGGAAAAAVGGGAEWLARVVLNAPDLAGSLRIASGLILAMTVLGVETGALAGLEAFRTLAATSLAGGVLTLALVVAGAAKGGVPGAVAGLALATFGWAAVARGALHAECRRRGLPVWRRPRRADARVLFGFSLPALLSSSMNVPFSWLAATILVRRPGGYFEMGLFSAANQWRLLIAFVPGVLERSALPILSSLAGAGDSSRFRSLLWTHIAAAAGGAACLAVPVSLAAPWVMGLYGAGFRPGWPLVPVLAGAAVLAAVNSAVGTAMVSRNRAWRAALYNAVWGATLLTASLVWIPSYGARGLAAALLAAYVVHTALQGAYVRQIQR
jgi:O-antigen/teichoic acid export membrane protein